MTIRFSNPPSVHAPLGLYSHTVSVPEGTELIFLSGQIGVRPDGEPAAYKRIAATLASGREAWLYIDARSAENAERP